MHEKLERELRSMLNELLARNRMQEMPGCAVTVTDAFAHPHAFIIKVNYCVESEYKETKAA